LFNTRSEEDEDGQNEEEGLHQSAAQNGFASFGTIPYLLEYCTATNTTIEDALNESCNFVFYIVTYLVLKNEEQHRQFEKIRNKHKI
jgi:hypothetical protein